MHFIIKLFRFALFLFIILSQINAKQLTVSSINDEIESHDGTFIMYYAPWCGHCKRVQQTWEQLSNKFNTFEDNVLNKKYLIGKIDCTVETELCSDHDILSYPTFIFYKNSLSESNRYDGDRDLKSFEAFIFSHFKSKKENDERTLNEMIVLNELNFDDSINDGYYFIKFFAPWCSHCRNLAATWKELAEIYNNPNSKVKIAHVDCTTNLNLCTKNGINAYPTLLLFNNGKLLTTYDGHRTIEDFTKFIQMLTQNSNEEKKLEGTTDKIKESENKIELNSDEIEKLLKERNFVFVMYFAPWCGHCRRLEPTWNELAVKFPNNKQISVVKIDCTINTKFCADNNIAAYPTLILYKNGEYLSEYSGARDLNSLFDFVNGHLKHDEL